ncbi:hypothetical protein BO71DRAFT_110742 [Aspergillus ellipticus CBS 707.79]|uniref:Intradiol ring-cleavage dioxygenases domain-containing protein n=1 Tax=Aspergillus ellipticus CBS 707.79 TaxID=1448320 RepID=A0A319DE51_9EURO|nr:hypothetical protein BO71DRAFT_110742 [Aspergillus ellipticus CBS 707.79]
MHRSFLLTILTLCLSVLAHIGNHDSAQNVAANAAKSMKCRDNVGGLNRRRVSRNLERRWHGSSNTTTTVSIVTEAPYYQEIQNDTLVLTPEVTQRPYVWPRSRILRQDMTESQPGVPLWLDIGVIDMSACDPLPNALVDIWDCNATGSYSSFTGLSPNTPFPQVLDKMGYTRDNFTNVTDLHTDNSTFLRGM